MAAQPGAIGICGRALLVAVWPAIGGTLLPNLGSERELEGPTVVVANLDGSDEMRFRLAARPLAFLADNSLLLLMTAGPATIDFFEGRPSLPTPLRVGEPERIDWKWIGPTRWDGGTLYIECAPPGRQYVTQMQICRVDLDGDTLLPTPVTDRLVRMPGFYVLCPDPASDRWAAVTYSGDPAIATCVLLDRPDQGPTTGTPLFQAAEVSILDWTPDGWSFLVEAGDVRGRCGMGAPVPAAGRPCAGRGR